MRISARSLRKVRRMKRLATVTSVNLVSLIDCFVILIIYLLVNTAAVQVIGAEQVDLPKSVSLEMPRENVAVIITSTDILVDGEAVMKLVDAEASATASLAPLRDKLLAEAPLPPKDAPKEALEAREVNILADKAIPYTMLKKVMATCSEAAFGKISLGVLPAVGGAQK